MKIMFSVTNRATEGIKISSDTKIKILSDLIPCTLVVFRQTMDVVLYHILCNIKYIWNIICARYKVSYRVVRVLSSAEMWLASYLGVVAS